MGSSRTAGVVSGPLAAFEAGFRAELRRTGYTPRSERSAVAAMAQLSGWMQRLGLKPEALSPAVLAARPRRLRGIRPVVRFLRRQGVVPAASCVDGAGPVEALQAEFAGWLTHERGLADETVRCYVGQSRAFLIGLGEPLDEALTSLDAATVTSFMLDHLRRLDGATAKASVTAIRALLRFLHVAGHVPVGLAGAVPAVAGWRQASLPRGLEPGQADRLLAGCDRTTPAGRRDYAVLMLLAQLGLRGGEVAALQLDDIDWHAGEIIVHGKAARVDRLPLPVAAGEALADYLTGGRPRGDATAVFITLRAPYRAISPHAVRQVMARACERAGLPRLGAHRLRHALACDLLQAGGSLAEVGQVLRHRSALATSVCAKVDVAALAELVRPWPGGGRWATSPPRGGDDGAYHSRRLMVVRIFARHLKTLDPTTEIPAPDVLPYHYRRVTPHVFSLEQIEALMAAADELEPRLRAVGWRMLIGLLAVTGLRISEACNLDRDDVDRDSGAVRIIDTKFNKSRLVFVHPSTLAALADYQRDRELLCPAVTTPALLISAYGTRLDAGNVQRTFAELIDAAGIHARPGQRRPRLHDIRHSFTVWTLLDWYRDGGDVQARLPALSTWLGHADPKSTYWYLQAVPELLALAAERLDHRDRQVDP